MERKPTPTMDARRAGKQDKRENTTEEENEKRRRRKAEDEDDDEAVGSSTTRKGKEGQRVIPSAVGLQRDSTTVLAVQRCQLLCKSRRHVPT